jgi:AcrR family transcriptional regulator
VESSGPMTQARRAGRPSQVTPAQIAEAALAVGLDKATVRNVADHLGMSVPGLYHHVRTREQLLILAAAHSFQALLCPDPEGKTWSEWLVEYCRKVFDTLVGLPELVAQIVAGTTNPAVHAQHLERYLEILGAHGFSVVEAYEFYQEVMSAVVGAAAMEIGDRAAEDAGRSLFPNLAAAVAVAPQERLVLVRRLVADRGDSSPDRFDAVRLLIEGMLLRRGP